MRHRALCALCLSLAASSLLVVLCPAATAAEWPSFRGPSFDARAAAPGLVAGLRRPMLAVEWRRQLGPGYSAVSVAGGRAVTQFSDGSEEVLIAFDVASGKELWRQALGKTYKGHDGSHDGPIATPAVGGDRVFAFTPYGRLHAFAAADGKPLWTVDLAALPDAEKPFYGYGSSPLLHGGRLWIEHTLKEKRLAAALDPATGAPLLQAGNDLAAYHSPLVARLAGREQILLSGMTKLYGLDAATGAPLWEFAHEGDTFASGGETITPLVIPGDRVLITPKNDTSTLLQVTAAGDGFAATALWSSKSLGRSYSRPVYHDGFFYGYVGGFLACVKAEDGSQVWRSRPPGDGFLLMLEDHLVIATKLGALHLAKASPEGYQEVAQLALFADAAWTGPSYAEGRIFARSMGEIAAVRVVEAPEQPAVDPALAALPADSAFRRFLEELPGSADKNKAVDAFLAGVASFPLVEGDWVHFLYRGDAKDVGLVGDMLGLRRQAALRRQPGTDLWVYSHQLVPGARVSYRFVQDYDNLIADPRNSRTETTVGQPGAPPSTHSWVSLHGWSEAAFLQAPAPAAAGKVERHAIKGKAEGHQRTVDVYLPPGYDPAKGPYPVVYVFGGLPALEAGKLPEVFDRLQGATAPFLGVFVQSAEPREHPANEGPKADAEDIASTVLPFVDGAYPTRRDAEGRGAYGVGFGATVALRSAMSRPDLYGRLAVQSTFLFESDLESTLEPVPPAAQGPRLVYLDWRRYDNRAEHEGWDVGKANALLAARLRAKGYDFAGGELPEGASWGTFRQHAGLIFPRLAPPVAAKD